MSNEPLDPDDPVDPTDEPALESSDDDTSEEAAGTGRRAGRGGTATAARPRPVKRQRTSPRQFLREVRSELRKVAWPSRRELLSYSLVVLVSVSLITLYITALDQLFGSLILRIFGA